MLMEKEGLIRRNKEKKFETADLRFGYGILQIVKQDGTSETLEMGKTVIKSNTENDCTGVIFLEELPHA